jgi:methionyl-tRNA formyltransferase
MSDREPLRVIVLTHGGVERTLAQLAALDGVALAGVFVEASTTPHQRRRSFREQVERSIRYEGLAATCARPLRKLATRLRRAQAASDAPDPFGDLRAVARQHAIPLHFVDDFHAPATTTLMRAVRPDLGVVYGTNILKESVFGIPRCGSINLHQGLVPFYRGGPVLFWELFNGEREVGITVHTVADKVDAGHVVVQATLPLNYDFEGHGLDFESFIQRFREQKMSELSARLIAEAVKLFAEGTARPHPQDLSIGRRYRLPTKREKDELRRRLRARRKQAASHAAANAHGIEGAGE